MPKYRAIAKGFDGKQIRLPGDLFHYEGKPGKWMELVDGQESKVEKPEGKSDKSKPPGKPEGK